MLEQLFSINIPHELLIVLISAVPIAELRGGIPVGIGLFHVPWYTVFLLGILGNMLPVPFLLLFFRKLVDFSRKIPLANKLITPIVNHAQRNSAKILKYETIGLALFVGVPIPYTGAWTGSIVASLLGLDFKKSLLSIFAGVVIAGIIVTVLSLMGVLVYQAVQ